MRAPEDGEDDDEDDFVDVPEKEGYEPHIPEHLRAEYGEFVQVHNAIRPVQAFSLNPDNLW